MKCRTLSLLKQRVTTRENFDVKLSNEKFEEITGRKSMITYNYSMDGIKKKFYSRKDVSLQILLKREIVL